MVMTVDVVVVEKVDDRGNDIEVERSTIETTLHLPQVPPSLLWHAPRQLQNTAAKQWSKVKSRENWGIGFASWRGIGKWMCSTMNVASVDTDAHQHVWLHRTDNWTYPTKIYKEKKNPKFSYCSWMGLVKRHLIFILMVRLKLYDGVDYESDVSWWNGCLRVSRGWKGVDYCESLDMADNGGGVGKGKRF